MKRIILLLLICVGLVLAGCAQKPGGVTTPTPPPSTPKATPTPAKTPTPTPKPTKTVTPVATPTKTAKPSPTVNCELCHTKATEYPPHVEGGKYCTKCHGTDPHKIHCGPGTINLKCEVCHGSVTNLTIPKPMFKGQSVCVNCHSPKDPTKPCTNLVEVHLGRGLPCTVCHTQPLSVIHKAADQYASGK